METNNKDTVYKETVYQDTGHNHRLGTILVGAAGVALLTIGGIYYGHKFKVVNKEADKTKIEYVKKDSVRVAENVKLTQKNDSSNLELKAKDGIIIDLNQNIGKLKRHLYNSDVKYNTELAKYNGAVLTIDSLKGVVNTASDQYNVLQNTNSKNIIEINNLGKLVDKYTQTNAEKDKFLAAEADTINNLQKYLDIYMVSRRPIKDRDTHKVYLPGNLRLLPTDLAKIKEIRALNKDYKNKK